MSIHVTIAGQEHPAGQIRELFWEYLQWGNSRISEEYKVSLDIARMLDGDMKNLGKYMPPQGRLLLGYDNDDLAGMICLKALAPKIGEIKRMYVRPEHRHKGLGRALVNRLVEEAEQIGYQRIRLDSAHFMTDAHRLYRSTGFKEIAPYEESEVPAEFRDHWIFMERALSGHEPDLEGNAA